MDVVCPSLPLNLLTPNGTADKLRPARKHTARIPAHGCRLVGCSLYVQLVNIESFSSRCAIQPNAQPSLYMTGPLTLSSFSLKIILRLASITLTACELPESDR